MLPEGCHGDGGQAERDGKQAVLPLLPHSHLWQDICTPLVLAWVCSRRGGEQGVVLDVSIPVSLHLRLVLATGTETALCSC